MQLEDIKKLAVMARIDMTEEEMTGLAHDFEGILAYIGQIQNAASDLSASSDSMLTNVMREDIVTNETAEYTQKILGQMPETQDGFLKVKQIL